MMPDRPPAGPQPTWAPGPAPAVVADPPHSSARSVAFGLGAAGLGGAAYVIAACALVPNPSTLVLVWLGGFGLTAQLLLVATAVVAVVTARPTADADARDARAGMARRLVMIIVLAAALTGGSAAGSGFLVATSYELTMPAVFIVPLTVAPMAATVLASIGVVMFHSAFAVRPAPTAGVRRWIDLPIERTRPMVTSLRLAAATMTAMALVGIAGTIGRASLLPDAWLFETCLCVAAHLTPIAGAVIALVAARAIRAGQVHVARLAANRQALDGLSALAVFVVGYAWAMSGIGITSSIVDPLPPFLTSMHFALLALTLLGPPICHAVIHRVLTVPPSACVQPEPPAPGRPAPAWPPPSW